MTSIKIALCSIFFPNRIFYSATSHVLNYIKMTVHEEEHCLVLLQALLEGDPWLGERVLAEQDRQVSTTTLLYCGW